MKWLDSFLELDDGDSIHIDGKCIRRAIAKSGKVPCIVSAYSSRKRIVIGQVKTDEKSNEITAIPRLLDILYLMGCIVTIDAAGCQKKITGIVREKHADYMLALKDNQKLLVEEVAELFETKFKDREKRFKEHSESVSVFSSQQPYPPSYQEFLIIRVIRNSELSGKSLSDISSPPALCRSKRPYLQGWATLTALDLT